MMNLTYIASSGNVYDLTARILTREASYHTWSYDPKATSLVYGERVSYFQRKALKYASTLLVRGNPIQRKAILTALHDDFERDVRLKQPGKLLFGEWYAECYIIGSETEPDKSVDHWTNNKVTIYVPAGFWIKEDSRSFTGAGVEIESTYLDYTYDYTYDYKASSSNVGAWVTDSPFESDFVLEVEGPAVNPRVVVNGYPYVVYATIPSGETMVIDSKKKTVMCGDTNLFDERNKVQSVFQKIPSGSLTLSWGAFDFTLTLHEERSEPRW